MWLISVRNYIVWMDVLMGQFTVGKIGLVMMTSYGNRSYHLEGIDPTILGDVILTCWENGGRVLLVPAFIHFVHTLSLFMFYIII